MTFMFIRIATMYNVSKLIDSQRDFCGVNNKMAIRAYRAQIFYWIDNMRILCLSNRLQMVYMYFIFTNRTVYSFKIKTTHSTDGSVVFYAHLPSLPISCISIYRALLNLAFLKVVLQVISGMWQLGIDRIIQFSKSMQ